MARGTDISGFILLVLFGLLTVQSKQVLWTSVPFNITWGHVGLIALIAGIWGIFGGEIRKAFKK